MNIISDLSTTGPALLGVIAGLIMLVGGGEIMVSGATRLAVRLGMSPLLIGLTVVAFGTSVPELFVSLSATLQGYPDIMIGNVVGSNIANVGLILGISALLKPLAMSFKEVRLELMLVIAGGAVTLAAALFGIFPRPLGILFTAMLIGYTMHAYKGGFNSGNAAVPDIELPEETPTFTLSALLVFCGLVLLAGGSNIFIEGAADLARHFGISELIIGLTLAAVGTSLPELASSLAALRRGEAGMLIGNVIGSNMFNLFMVLGLTASLTPVSLSRSLLVRDLPTMLCYSLILVPLLSFRGYIGRPAGALLLLGYAGYCLSLL